MKLPILHKKELAEGVWEISLGLGKNTFAFVAGQYVRVVLPYLEKEDTKGPARLFSVASSPNDKKKIDIAFRLSESGFTKTLSNIPVGTEVEVEGPWGAFVFPENVMVPMVFIAGGIGIAPFLSMLRYACEEKLPYKINLLYTSRDEESAVYLKELKKLEKANPNFKMTAKFGPLDEDFIRQNIPPGGGSLFYVSGSSSMLDAAIRMLNKLGVPDEQIRFEEWSELSFHRAIGKMFSASPDGILVSDLSGYIRYVNSAWEKLTGWTGNEIKDKFTPRILKSEKHGREFYKDLWERVLEGGTVREEMVEKRKDGSLYDTDEVYLPLRNRSGGIFGIVAFQRDISFRKKMEKDLIAAKGEAEEKEAKDRALLESIGEGMIATDTEGKILSVNRAFEKLLGWKQDEVIGKRLAEIIPREDEAGNRISFEEKTPSRVFAGSLPFFYFVRKDKTRLPVSSVISPVTRDRTVIGAVEVFHDLTGEKELEKLRMDFLSLASHQLRTPLSGTKWLIETMKRGVTGTLNEKQSEYIDEIYRTNERMIKLVFDIMNVLRLESGTAIIKKEKVFVSDLAENLAGKMEPLAKDKKIAFRNNLKKYQMVAMESDAAMLSGILESLVSNALNFSAPGKEVICDAKAEADAVMFFVKDSGIGIPKDEQRRIFEKFYRASNAKQTVPGGTGLGLYIASMLADKIGAKLSFESEEGKGSTFYLRVPKRFAKIST